MGTSQKLSFRSFILGLFLDINENSNGLESLLNLITIKTGNSVLLNQEKQSLLTISVWSDKWNINPLTSLTVKFLKWEKNGTWL